MKNIKPTNEQGKANGNKSPWPTSANGPLFLCIFWEELSTWWVEGGQFLS